MDFYLPTQPTCNPYHVKRVVENVLLSGGEIATVDLHENRLRQKGDEEPHV